jgi:glycerol kinase
VLLQAVADLSGLSLEVARDLEATARGIAALAAAAVGVLDPDASGHAVAHRVDPALDAAGRARERERWCDALAVHVRPQAFG